MDNLTQRILKKATASKKGCKKAGRNKVKCAYFRVSRYRTNKLSGLNRHLSVHVNDTCAITALDKLKKFV